jgi:uncharacterized protein YggE
MIKSAKKGGKNMKKKFSDENIKTFVIAAVILIVAFGAMIMYKPATTVSDSVSVSGIATVKAMPDLVTVYFNAEGSGETSTEASEESSAIYNQLVENLKNAGFDDNDLVTENMNVYQDYDWTDEGRKDNGFKASHGLSLEISIEEQDMINDAVDAGVSAGALISSINFELTQESQNMYKAEAMKLAAQDSKIKAESVAEGFDKKVGKLVNVQVDNFGYYPWNVYSARGLGVAEDADAAKEVASNINPGEKEISASVSAVYKLK